MSETSTLPLLAVAFGADHAGVALKDVLAALRDEGFAVHHLGTIGADPVDYPDYAYKVAVADGTVRLGVRVRGTGFDGGRDAPRVAKPGLAGKPAA